MGDSMKKETKIDQRIQKTYQSLITAFFQLLNERKFEEVTVNDLCNQANIRRATFYKHFADKYDFFTFVVDYIFDQYTPDYDCSIPRVRPLSFYLGIIEHILCFLSERESMVRMIAESGMYATLKTIIITEISGEIQAYLEDDQKNGAVLPASPEITAQFFTGAIITSITYWFSSDRSLSQEELLKQLTSLINEFRFIQVDSACAASVSVSFASASASTASDRLP